MTVRKLGRLSQAVLGALTVVCCVGVRPVEALTIFNVTVKPQEHGVTVSWNTDQPTDGFVDILSRSSRGSSGFGVSDLSVPLFKTSHSISYTSPWILPENHSSVTITSKTTSGQTATAGPIAFQSSPDVTPPTIANVQLKALGSHSATIGWELDEITGSGFVDYGTDLAYGQTVQSTSEQCPISLEECATRHTGVLSGLRTLTNYQLQVRSDDGHGHQAVPAGNFTVPTESLWEQLAFQTQPLLYGRICVAVTDAPGCISSVQRVWPKEMSWTGNQLLVHFNASAEDLIRGQVALRLHVTAVQDVAGRWVRLEVAAGTDPAALVVIHPGLTLDHPGSYAAAFSPTVLAPGLNYLRLRATTIPDSEIGYGQAPPFAVWDHMQLAFTQLQAPALSDAQLLDRTEAQAARYFWEQAFTTNGFVRDLTNASIASVGATGFGLSALVVLAERSGTSPEWTVTPAQARARAQKILDAAVAIQQQQAGNAATYGKAGFPYHFVDAQGRRAPNSEVSTADAALFLAGALAAGRYFGGTVQTRANQFLNNVDWSYFFDAAPIQFRHAWRPERVPGFDVVPPDGQGWLSNQLWDRPTDEVLLISLLALASDTGHVGFRRSLYRWPRVSRSYAGYQVVSSYFGSLFTYLFGQCFFDFEAMGSDNPASLGESVQSVNWFLNAKNAALANRQFAIDQSGTFPAYGPEQWGLSACYRPSGSYFGENGAKPAEINGGNPIHDGTVPPYGAISTIPLVRVTGQPLSSNLGFQALRHYYDTHFSGLWGTYGPRDSLKTQLQSGQLVTTYSPLYVGIDVGPEVLMIENYRTRLVPRVLMSHPDVLAAIRLHFPAIANRGPVLRPIGDKVVPEGQQLAFTISAVDPNGDTLTYSATGLPAGATFQDRTFRWTTKFDQAGNYSVTFTARDPAGLSDTEQIKMTVTNVPLAVTSVSDTPDPFSPNGDGIKDTTRISGTFNHTITSGKLEIKNASGTVIRRFEYSGPRTSISQTWGGKNTNGVVVRDGQYTYTIGGVDAGGSQAKKSGTVTVNNP